MALSRPAPDLAPERGDFAPRLAATSPRRGWGARAADLLLGRGMTLGLAVGALVLGVATFAVLSDGSPFGPSRPGQVVGLILVNLAVLGLLGASLAGRLVRMWVERRRGSAGSRLHTRLVLLFGVVAVVPATLVAGFAAVFFNLGIEAWFSDRVRTALEASLAASRAYLEEHRNTIRADALSMAANLDRAQVLLGDNTIGYARVLATYTALRNLTEAYVYEPVLGRVVAHAGISTGFVLDPPPDWALTEARLGEVALMPDEQAGKVRALVALAAPTSLMLLIGRPLDPIVLDHMARTESAVAAYHQLDRNRGGLQVTFAMIFAIAALLVLLAAVLVGLVLANQLVKPIGRLITAAERVRAGDLSTRVEEGPRDDEMSSLARAFNRMTNQLAAQRGELLQAWRQVDDRRRFTETVLAGVSAGVIGLDPEGRINLLNRRASELLGRDLDAESGRLLAEVAPEFAALLATPAAGRTAEIRIGVPADRRTLLARLEAERRDGEVAGSVLTFDDITALLTAQRQAAWSDVARRIAHEIKNPLTPIQLSAERLKRRYLKQITDDPETFRQCTDTIVRQVGDIGRMVDEFSAFARMPQPVIKPEDLAQVARDSLVLPRQANPGVAYALALPDAAPIVPCDRRLLGQALVNLLQNAADAIAGASNPHGHITVRIEAASERVSLVVEDDGPGLPQGEERDRLTEPYVTHKAKGTGLGLAIVKKIMEDHGGRLVLEDRPGGGARAVLVLPWRPPVGLATDRTATAQDDSMRRAHGA